MGVKYLTLNTKGKNMSIEQSVQNAIMASSLFSQFVKEELPELFEEQGVENIYTRIGIDVGEAEDAEDTLWYLAGMDECSEVTTCSLHTSLAAHMQGNALHNGIVLGDHVKVKSGYHKDLFYILTDKDGMEDRYIFQIPEENFNYTQWAFRWKEFLNQQESAITIPNIIPVSQAHVVAEKNLDYLREQAAGIKPYSYE